MIYWSSNKHDLLNTNDESQIINTFNNKKVVNDFSAVVSYKDIKAKNFSFSAGQYFEIKIDYIDITKNEFDKKIIESIDNLTEQFEESKKRDADILRSFKKIKYEW